MSNFFGLRASTTTCAIYDSKQTMNAVPIPPNTVMPSRGVLGIANDITHKVMNTQVAVFGAWYVVLNL
jgi:hypothetical protein